MDAKPAVGEDSTGASRMSTQAIRDGTVGVRKGFVRVARAFFTDLAIPREARILGVTLAMLMNRQGLAWPSEKTLACLCGFGQTRAKRAPAWLGKAGFISLTRCRQEGGQFVVAAWDISRELVVRRRLFHGQGPFPVSSQKTFKLKPRPGAKTWRNIAFGGSC